MEKSKGLTSFLLFLEPGRSISRTMWDMPACVQSCQLREIKFNLVVLWVETVQLKAQDFSTQVQRWIFGSSFVKSCMISLLMFYLIPHEASQVDILARIVLGEGLGLAAMALGPFLWEESLGPMTGSFEFPVRHRGDQPRLEWSSQLNMCGTILPPNFITTFTGCVCGAQEYSYNTIQVQDILCHKHTLHITNAMASQEKGMFQTCGWSIWLIRY